VLRDLLATPPLRIDAGGLDDAVPEPDLHNGESTEVADVEADAHVEVPLEAAEVQATDAAEVDAAVKAQVEPDVETQRDAPVDGAAKAQRDAPVDGAAKAQLDAHLEPQLDAPAAGRQVGPFRLGRILAEGGSSTVHVATMEPTHAQEVALKVLAPELTERPGFLDRLRSTLTQVTRMRHQGVLPILKFGTFDGHTCVATTLVSGGTLRDRLQADGRMEPPRALALLRRVAGAVHTANESGIVHRDLCPGNIFFNESGESLLGGFGTAPIHLGISVGTPGYLPPEQALGEPSGREADVFSLGAIAFEVLTGTPPYSAETATELLMAAVQEPVPSAWERRPDLPSQLDEVLTRAMARRPGDRHRSVLELVEDLARVPWDGHATAEPAQFGLIPAPQPAPHLTPQAQLAPEPVPQPAPTAAPDLTEELEETPFAAACVQFAERVAGAHGSAVLTHAGLQDHVTGAQHTEVPEGQALTSLTTGFEVVFGEDAPGYLHRWGELVGEEWLRSIQQRPAWMAGPATGRLVDLLSVLIEALNGLQVEGRFEWKQVNRNLFRLVHERSHGHGQQLNAEACHFWRGVYEAAFRWSGLEREWLLDEVECGRVSGTQACVFTIVRNGPGR
jgi:serine/threonine-protein kinase